MRKVPFLPPTPTTPGEYEEYRVKVLVHRVGTYRHAEMDESVRAREIVRCAADPVYFAATYGTIYEARNPENANEPPGGYLPFIPYPFQIDAFDWFEQRLKSTGRFGDGVVPKSRDMGLTNIAMFWAGWHWLFGDNFQARLISWKEAKVDEKGNPDSAFWKLETFLKGLPEWLLQSGCNGKWSWEPSKGCRKKLMFRNPRNGNTIIGESTQNKALRGGRATVVFLDEAAYIAELSNIWTGLRAATRHRIAISTVSLDEGYDFYNMHYGKADYKGRQPAILEIPWYVHPLHTPEWFQSEMERDTEEGFRREVLMDYFAGGGKWCYPMAQLKEVGDFDFEPLAGPLTVAIDDGFDDDGAAVLVQYNVRTGRHRVIDAVIASDKTADWWGSILTGIPRSDFDYDEDAVQFMRLMRQLPGVTFVGDSHVRQSQTVTGSSFQEHLARNWNVHIISSWGPKGQWTKAERINRLTMILPVLDFNGTKSCEYVLAALQRNRFRTRKEGHQESTESQKDIHDWTTHPTSALEWYGVNFEDFKGRFSGKKISWTGQDNL